MTSKLTARFAGIAAGAAMVVAFAAPAGAQTVAELQAQIAALMAQLQALSGGASASATITSDLTVGSTGSQVVALQNALVAQGYLTMPAGVAPGYFGALTKAAVAKWQAAMGLPATGYFGPLSRAKFAGTSTGGTTGGTTTGGTVSGAITTPGMEGDITVTSAPVSDTTAYEGDAMTDVLAFKVEASGSDMAVQRVRIDLGTDSTLYRDVIEKIYVVDDAGKTLVSADLNNSTVVRNASDEYEITLTGFSSVVAKGKTRIYTVKADVQDNVDSADLTSYTFALSENGVRAIDGAGIDAFDPTADTDVTKSITFSADLADSASLTVSTNTSTPLAREIVAKDGSNENEVDKVVLLVFDIRAEKDDIEITDLQNFTITNTGTGSRAVASTSYLYVGNGTSGQLLGSDSVDTGAGDVDFTDISYTIPAGTTRTFTLAVDIRSASANQATLDASFTGSNTNVVAENSDGDTLGSSVISGSAAANDLLVRNVGAIFSLVGTPTITKSATASQNNTSTSTLTATFNVKIEAVGTDILLGNNASTTYPMVSNGTGAPARSFDIYLAGAVSNPAVASSTDFTQPSSGVVDEGSNSFTVQEGNNVTIPVTFLFEGRTTAGVLVTTGNYAVGLERINWVSGGTQRSSTFMDGRTEWRTPSQTLP